jgi:hypothetical protein
MVGYQSPDLPIAGLKLLNLASPRLFYVFHPDVT